MAEIQKTCKDCVTELNEDDKHGLCDECRAARRAKLKSRFKTGAKIAAGIGAAVGLIYLASKSSDDDSDSFPSLDTDDTLETDIGASEVPEHDPGEKYWNSRIQNWEKDGKPYTYRVTYKDARDGEIHTHDYSDVDNGYEDYEYYRKRWYTSQVEWDHVPPCE